MGQGDVTDPAAYGDAVLELDWKFLGLALVGFAALFILWESGKALGDAAASTGRQVAGAVKQGTTAGMNQFVQ